MVVNSLKFEYIRRCIVFNIIFSVYMYIANAPNFNTTTFGKKNRRNSCSQEIKLKIDL